MKFRVSTLEFRVQNNSQIKEIAQGKRPQWPLALGYLIPPLRGW